MNTHQALEILGLSGDTTIDILKKKYRQLVSRNHPDKFSGCSASTLSLQESVTKQINLAYEYLLNNFYPAPTSSVDVDIGVAPDQFFLARIAVHPEHKSGAFQKLWHEIRSIRGKKDFSLAMELYALSINYLLQDFKKYPDLDGILHNYIRDYTTILVNIGKYEDAFALIKLSIINNFRSYYDYNPPFLLLFTNIIKTRLQQRAIAIWSKYFIGDIVITHTPTQWSIAYTFFINKRYRRIFECIEEGFLPVNEDTTLLSKDAAEKDLIVISEKNYRIKDPAIYQAYLDEMKKAKEEDATFVGKIIRIMISSQKELDEENFSTLFPKCHKIIKTHKDENLKNPLFEINKRIPGSNGNQGSNPSFIQRDCHSEALEIFSKFIKPHTKKVRTPSLGKKMKSLTKN